MEKCLVRKHIGTVTFGDAKLPHSNHRSVYKWYCFINNPSPGIKGKGSLTTRPRVLTFSLL